jgi:glycosyltransferase involved in cell wall biosynthesis
VKVLAVATHPVEGASTRYRLLAYLPALERHGFRVTFHPFFPSGVLDSIYGPGNRLRRAYYVLRGTIERSIYLRSREFALLFIHRELFPLGRSFLLSRLKKREVGIVYDYDDALFLPQRRGRWLLEKLEDPDGTRQLIAASDTVIAGNAFLLEYAKRYNPRAILIPTAIETAKIRARAFDAEHGRCVVGWIGSHTTEKYVHGLVPVLEKLSANASFSVKIVGARQEVSIGGVEVVQLPWELNRETEDFQSCDIGVYPLWNDEWAKGKCGFKAIQFMAAGVPVVASSVGANSEIIRDGVDGFLASSEEEWYSKILLLLRDAGLRREMGLAGRRTVEERYSLGAHTPRFLAALDGVVERKGRIHGAGKASNLV